MPRDLDTAGLEVDHGKLIMLEAEGARQGTYVNVVVNWFQELAARVPR